MANRNTVRTLFQKTDSAQRGPEFSKVNNKLIKLKSSGKTPLQIAKLMNNTVVCASMRHAP